MDSVDWYSYSSISIGDEALHGRASGEEFSVSKGDEGFPSTMLSQAVDASGPTSSPVGLLVRQTTLSQ